MGRPRTFDDDTVLARAMDTFWTHGYAGTSPAQLAAAAGIAKGSLYNAFTSKRELFVRCLDVYQAQIAELANALMAQPGTARECIGSALKAVVDADLAQPQRRGCLVGNSAVELARHDPDLARTLRRMQDESTGWFEDRIRRGQTDGDVSPDRDPRALADFLATTLTGLRVMVMTHDAPTLHRVVDTAVSLL